MSSRKKEIEKNMSEMNKKIKIIFMGTPDFACQTLKKLLDDDSIDVVLVVTKEDKPSGRGKEMRESDVKKYFKLYCDEKINDNKSCGCEQCDKYILTPHKIKEDRDAIEFMKKLEPDFIVVVAYGQILSKEILDIPKRTTLSFLLISIIIRSLTSAIYYLLYEPLPQFSLLAACPPNQIL